jgi:hypothetical protein
MLPEYIMANPKAVEFYEKSRWLLRPKREEI